MGCASLFFRTGPLGRCLAQEMLPAAGLTSRELMPPSRKPTAWLTKAVSSSLRETNKTKRRPLDPAYQAQHEGAECIFRVRLCCGGNFHFLMKISRLENSVSIRKSYWGHVTVPTGPRRSGPDAARERTPCSLIAEDGPAHDAPIYGDLSPAVSDSPSGLCRRQVRTRGRGRGLRRPPALRPWATRWDGRRLGCPQRHERP